jgi:hypothetical protein
VRGHHHQHAEHAKQPQYIIFAAQATLRRQVAARIGKGTDGDQEDAGLEQRRHRVMHKGASQQHDPGIIDHARGNHGRHQQRQL